MLCHIIIDHFPLLIKMHISRYEREAKDMGSGDSHYCHYCVCHGAYRRLLHLQKQGKKIVGKVICCLHKCRFVLLLPPPAIFL